MNILYVSQNFPPEIGAASARAFELSRHWVANGHQVVVLTGFPNYPTGSMNDWRRENASRLTRRESIEGINVVRTWLWDIGDRRVRDRVLSYSSFWLSSSLRGVPIPRPDVIVASSPPLTVGLTGWWLGRIKRRPFVFDVRDLWPESITDLGALTNKSAAARALGSVAKFLYRKADRIVVTSDATREALAASGAALARITTIPNGVETQIFLPRDSADATRKELGLSGKFVVSFIGTIGLAQDIDVVIRSASRLQVSLDAVHLLFVGEGPMKRHAMDAVARQGLSNVTFLPGQGRDGIPKLVQASDACLVTLRKADVNGVVIPVRMLEFMSCGRPVVLCAEGQSARMLREAKAGLVIGQGNDAALAAAVVRLSRDKELRRKMGANGRRYIVQNYSREQTAHRYLEVLKQARLSYVKKRGKSQ